MCIRDSFSSNTDIEQICIAGLGCTQPVALVSISDIGAAKSKENLSASLEATLKNVNKDLRNFEKISTIIVTKDAWTVENGLVTPTLKVKRGEMNKKFGQKLMDWQESKNKVVYEA